MNPNLGLPKKSEERMDKLTLESIKRFLGLAYPYRKVFIIGSVLTLVSTGINLSLPFVAQKLMPDIIKNEDVGILDKVAFVFGGAMVVGTLIQFVQWRMVARAGNAVVTDLRARLFTHLQRLPISYFDKSKSGELTSRLSNDVSLIQQTLTLDIVNMLANAIQMLGGIVIAIVIDWKMATGIIAVILLLMLVYLVAGKRIRRLNRLSLDSLSESMGAINETLSNVRIVKAFAREDHEDKRVGKQLVRFNKLADRSSSWEAAVGSIGLAGFMLLVVAVLWIGGRRVIIADMPMQNLLAFLMAIVIMSGPMGMLTSLYSRLQRAVGAADRLFEMLDEPREPHDPADAVPFPDGATEVSFKNVVFGYDAERPVLKGLNLCLPAGKVTALVGQSGAGKTTLSALMYRFYEPQSGDINVDGVPINQMVRKDLREHIGIVPQMPVLFNVSIRENIRYGRLDASNEEIEAAAKAANVHELVEKLPFKYDTLVGERGITLSGGQNQRVAIARALLKNPRLLILDEATSALDTRSEALVKEALERLMQGRTTLVIAHRLTTIQNADQIAVINNGQVVEIGRHDDLLSQNGHYARIHNMAEEVH